MNKKLIAVAVAGVVAAPVAYADISAYGRINNRIVLTENAAGDNVQNMETSGSRFGFKGSGDMGNGMTAFARYEWSTTTDNAGSAGGLGVRLGFVGVSGPFGTVSLGQQWSAYFTNFGTYTSQNIHKGPGQMGPFRTGNTVQYSNSFGPVSMKLDARVDDKGDGQGNGFGIGVTLNPMDNVTLAGAMDNNDDNDKEFLGVAGSVGLGMLSLTVGHEQMEQGTTTESTNTILWVNAAVTDQLGLNLGVSKKEDETATSTTETDMMTVSGVLNLGGGLKLWGEFTNTDEGGSDSDSIAMGMRLDF